MITAIKVNNSALIRKPRQNLQLGKYCPRGLAPADGRSAQDPRGVHVRTAASGCPAPLPPSSHPQPLTSFLSDYPGSHVSGGNADGGGPQAEGNVRTVMGALRWQSTQAQQLVNWGCSCLQLPELPPNTRLCPQFKTCVCKRKD